MNDFPNCEYWWMKFVKGRKLERENERKLYCSEMHEICQIAI